MDHKLVRAISSVTCVMLMVKALAMVKNILQARVFGAGADVDAFTMASNYSIALFTTLCYALCIAAIPILTRKLMQSREAGYRTANILISNTVVLSLAVTGVLLLVGAAGGMEQLLGVGEPVSLFRFCFLVMVPSLPIIALTYLLLALFQSMDHFTLQGRLSLLYNVMLCAVLLLAGDRLPLTAFAVLTSAGWLLQLAMVLPSMRKEGYRLRPKLAFRGEGYGIFLRTSVMTMYVSSLFLLCYLVNTRFATAGAEGTVAGFFYAERLYEPLSTALIYSAGIVLFPDFSQKYTQVGAGEYRRHVVLVLKNTLLVLLPVSLLFAAFGTPVIRVLFEGGDFTGRDALLSGSIFSWYILGLVGFLMLDLLSKAYFAMGRTLPPILMATAVLAVCVGANLLCHALAPGRPELLAGGTSLGFLAVGAVAYAGFARQGGVPLPWKPLLCCGIFSLLTGGLAWGAYRWMVASIHSKLGMVLVCCAVGAVVMVLYLALMGPMLPTRQLLKKLGRRSQVLKSSSLRFYLTLILALCGVLCSGILLFSRVSAEGEDRQVCAALSLADLDRLAEESGLPEETWRTALEGAGVCQWIGAGEDFVLPEDAAPNSALPLALVENETRTSVNLPEGFDLDAWSGPMVKTLWLYDDYANRAQPGDAQEIENLLFRAATDRGMRLLILTPFTTAEGELILDPAVYVTCLDNLAQRLEARGLTFGTGFSCLETAPVQPLLLWGAGLIPILLGVWLVCRWRRLAGWEGPLLCLGALALAALCFLRPELTQKLLMLLSAVAFPCAAAWFLAGWSREGPPRLSQHHLVWDSVLAMGVVVGWSLLGGLHVAALMASRDYLMGVEIFSGVKLALLFPLVVCALFLLWALRREILALRRRWPVLLLAVVLFGGICGVFLLRSGDWKAFSSLETALREGMESALYARPRSKELLLAAPCVALFLWACRRKVLFFQFFCGVGVCLEVVSVVNTFCHGVAPVQVSLIRSLLGAGLGLCLGLVAVAVAELLLRAWRARSGKPQAG